MKPRPLPPHQDALSAPTLTSRMTQTCLDFAPIHSIGLGNNRRQGRSAMRIGSLVTAATFVFIALLAQSVAATAAEVKVMAGAAMRGAFGELVPQFERSTGHKIVIEYGGGGTLRKQI